MQESPLNDSSTSRKVVPLNGGSTHVRFTPEQFERITQDSKVTGESLPNLLKETYFSRPARAPLMRKDDVAMVMNQLIRIGNNLNQVARHLNSGFRSGFNEELQQISRDLTLLTKVLTSTYYSSNDPRE